MSTKRKQKNIKSPILTYLLITLILGLFMGSFTGYQVGMFVGRSKSSDKKETITGSSRRSSKEEKIALNQKKEQKVQNSKVDTSATQEAVETTEEEVLKDTRISWNSQWRFADYSKIHSDSVMLHYSKVPNKKNITVAVNAGHGTSGGSSQQTLCHPDGSPKVTGGSTASGSTYATAIAEGTTLSDGTPESVVTLRLAQTVKNQLLENGYNVLMIRDSQDVQLDNIARTIFANENADCHISLHYDSTGSDKGFFYISVPSSSSYRSMEPVASHWQEHNRLGESILFGMKNQNVKIWSEGSMEIDLTQTSYSTVPSVDLEVGDEASDYSQESLDKLARGIQSGLNSYFGK